MRVLVTGANGFVGRHLCALLHRRGDTVVEGAGPHTHAGAASAGAVQLDIADPKSVAAAVAEAKPEGIIHLAGFSSVARSHEAPAEAFQVNALGTVNLLQAVREQAPKARVVLVGSGEMYGAVPLGHKAAEQFPLRPLSPYAASKVSAELAGTLFHQAYKLDVICARPFNHLGPGQDPRFVVPSFARQIAQVRAGKAEPVLRTGDLSPVRDFCHVEDVVAAYRLLLEQGRAGLVYNVCSGEGRSIRSLLDELLELAGVKASVETDPARLRPVELPSLVGDDARLKALGWRRAKTVRDALAEVLAEQSAAA